MTAGCFIGVLLAAMLGSVAGVTAVLTFDRHQGRHRR